MILRLNVDGNDFVGDSRSEFQCLLGDAAPAFDGYDGNGRGSVNGGLHRFRTASGYGYPVIVLPHFLKNQHDHGYENDRDPRTIREFRHQDDHDRDARDQRPQGIDQHAVYPAWPAPLEPVRYHAQLREGKRRERAHRVKRNQAIGDAAEKNQQKAGSHGKNDDAVGVDQAASAIPEDVRQVVVESDRSTKARKIGKRGVGGERKDQQNRGDGHVVERAFSKYRKQEHRQNALVSGLTRVGSGDVVHFDEIG